MIQEPVRRTVGDTLTIIQHLRTVPGAVVQPRTLTDSSLVTLLSPPTMTRDGINVQIAYRVAVWQPGTTAVALPGPVIVTPNGHVDTMPDYRVQLLVGTVLPRDSAATKIAPKAARPVIPRGDRTVIPFLLLLGILACAVAFARWWVRRRGPVPVFPTVLPPPPLDAEQLERWLAAGEAQLALRHVEALVRDRPELAEWRARAATARYAASGDAELADLVREGWAHCS